MSAECRCVEGYEWRIRYGPDAVCELCPRKADLLHRAVVELHDRLMVGVQQTCAGVYDWVENLDSSGEC